MDDIAEFARQHDLHVIEDLAEAHGVMPHSDTAAAVWSFYRNKTIHGAEGGIIAFRDEKHANRARQLRCLGFTDDHDFMHTPRGVNARMSDVHAELILNSLHQAPENIAKRNRVAGWYDQFIPKEFHMPARDAAWVYDLRVPGMSQGQQSSLVSSLKAVGIAARHAFKPSSEQPEWRIGRDYERLDAFRLSREVIYLPISPEMARSDAERVSGVFCESLAKVLA